jgi:hypothetical protein
LRTTVAKAGAFLTGTAALVLGGLAPTAHAADGWTTYTLATPNATYHSIYAAGSEAWIVGTVNPQPTHSTVLQHFDGSAWSPVAVPNLGSGRVITGTSATDLWIGGGATAHFDGERWTTYQVPDRWPVVQLYAAGPNNVWGVTQTPGTSPVYDGQRLIHFDGTAWSLATPPQVAGYTEPDIQLSGSGTDVWVNYSDRDGGENTLLRTSGTGFTAIPSPGYGVAVVPLGPNDAWASGPIVADSGNGDVKANPLRWNGRAWAAVDDGQQWTTYQPRVAVGGTVWANRFEFFSGYGVVSLVRWTGSGWATVPGISGVGSDGVFDYAAPGPWALLAQGRDKNRQTVKVYAG